MCLLVVVPVIVQAVRWLQWLQHIDALGTSPAFAETGAPICCRQPCTSGKSASDSKTLGKQSTLPLLREPCQGPLRIARKGSWRSREGLLEAKSTPYNAVAAALRDV